MVHIHETTGECREIRRPPSGDWQAVPGRGALLRRREDGRWRAAHAFEPDAPLWIARGWERVQFRSAAPTTPPERGRRSRLRIALAVPVGAERTRVPQRWVVLPDEPGLDSAAARPGAQALFRLSSLREGAPEAEIAARLLTGRIVAAGLPLERALWVLQGPPVSPQDAVMVRKLASVLALAGRLSLDLAALIEAHVDGDADRPEGSAPPAPTQ